MRIKKKFLIGSCVAILFCGGVTAFVFLRSKNVSLNEKVQSKVSSARTQEQNTETKHSEDPLKASPVKMIKEVLSAQNEVKAMAPAIDQIRKEVTANPHDTPPSLLKFAAYLGPRLEAALKSEPLARELFAELEACVESLDYPVVQAICLSSANLLAEAHSSLEKPFESLKERVQPEVVELAGSVSY